VKNRQNIADRPRPAKEGRPEKAANRIKSRKLTITRGMPSAERAFPGSPSEGSEDASDLLSDPAARFPDQHERTDRMQPRPSSTSIQILDADKGRVE
jgi:hypothetical protein